MQAYLFLFLLLAISLIAKNQSLLIATGLLIVLKAINLEAKWFEIMHKSGINWGVTVITIAVLVPIATGAIGFKDLGAALKSPYAWVALIAGILVALIAKNGVMLLAEDPHITASLVFGTILAVALFNGVAVGPLIGAGIAYYAMKLFSVFY